jgi:outer membrane protein OmpA-like peptidoglycan-associated protein
LRNVFFVLAKAEMLPTSYPELDRLVTLLQENPTIEIELGGHTDNQGSAELNKRLSEDRVTAVKNYLVSKGIAASRITGKGYGFSQPIAANDTEANRQLNRRVEFKILRK